MHIKKNKFKYIYKIYVDVNDVFVFWFWLQIKCRRNFRKKKFKWQWGKKDHLFFLLVFLIFNWRLWFLLVCFGILLLAPFWNFWVFVCSCFLFGIGASSLPYDVTDLLCSLYHWLIPVFDGFVSKSKCSFFP